MIISFCSLAMVIIASSSKPYSGARSECVVASVQTNPSTIAEELRRQADAILDLADLRSSIERITPTPERREHLAADPVAKRG
jgi:hypothetical protein